ncbi:ATP-binding protein [Streptomyces xantholiticus]|uniref:ATP-binding protein n=1 Tax=Streptomyces xantholiticus TaxID=68285 RepID=A0ABV1V5X1_9ACTN
MRALRTAECVRRKPVELPFLAEPREVAGLRRIMRLHLETWGLHEVVETAKLCLSELVSNVIKHVGSGTPTRLMLSMRGTRLRIEVQDPDARALPTLLAPDWEAEGGRGVALLDSIADSWGVVLRENCKITWCELATSAESPHGHVTNPGVVRADALLGLYGTVTRQPPPAANRLCVAVAEEAAVDVIADLLLWLRAHGRDVDDALDRALIHCDAELNAKGTFI